MSSDQPKLPADPLATIVAAPDYHRLRITGILESYNSNYDVLTELVQNAVDAVEDAFFSDLDLPYHIPI